jgi:hypothetical protein
LNTFHCLPSANANKLLPKVINSLHHTTKIYFSNLVSSPSKKKYQGALTCDVTGTNKNVSRSFQFYHRYCKELSNNLDLSVHRTAADKFGFISLGSGAPKPGQLEIDPFIRNYIL